MLKYNGGSPAKDGFYWKKGEWEIVTVEGRDGRLPGGIECEYIRVPSLLFVPVAIALSVPFVIFLPFIGFAMLFVLVGVKAGRGVAVLSRAVAERAARLRAAVTETAEELVTDIAEELAPEPAEEVVMESAEDLEPEPADDFPIEITENYAADSSEHVNHML